MSLLSDDDMAMAIAVERTSKSSDLETSSQEEGCGGYADNSSGAVSTTGHGETIMKVVLARLILFHMEQGQSAEAASDSALAYMKTRVGGLGGVVTVDPQGNWAARFSSLQMAWAAAQKDTLHYGLYTGEHFTQSLDDPH